MSEAKKSNLPATINEQGMVDFKSAEELFNTAKILIALGAVPDRFKDPRKLTGPLFFLAQHKRPYSFLRLIAEIQGSMCIFAEGLPALGQQDPNYGDIEEFHIDENGKRIDENNPKAEVYAAVVKVRRKTSSIWSTYMFSKYDALKANLFKNPVWKSYPKDMLLHRARARAYKAQYPNALLGLDVYEDRIDIMKEVSESLNELRQLGDASGDKKEEAQSGPQAISSNEAEELLDMRKSAD